MEPSKMDQFNNLVNPLMTDMYQLTMCYAYWLDGKHQDKAVFELFFRKNPFDGEYTIFAGLEDCIKFIHNFKYTQKDVEYLTKVLKQNNPMQHVEPKFIEYLMEMNAKEVKLFGFQEGSVCFPNTPLLRLEGPLGVLPLLETPMLNLINYASLLATNAARYRYASDIPKREKRIRLLEFGLRRAQGPDGAFSASRYAYMGGFDATSNVSAGQVFGIPTSGTHGHAFIMSYHLGEGEPVPNKPRWLLNLKTKQLEDFTKATDVTELEFCAKKLTDTHHQAIRSELEAFKALALAFPNNFTALVDTYNVQKSGLINFSFVALTLIKFGYKPLGIRIDSGDLAYLSLEARAFFERIADSFGVSEFRNIEIMASNDINEETINSLNAQGHAITSMGIGTHLVTCQKQPSLGCVCKLVETNGEPCMKLSSTSEKVTIPSLKNVYRLYGQEGCALLDLLTQKDEPPPRIGAPVLCRHPLIVDKRCNATPRKVEAMLHLWWDGQLVKPLPTLAQIRQHVSNSLTQLRPDIKRKLNPTPYKVSVSEKLFDLFSGLRLRLTPIGELN